MSEVVATGHGSAPVRGLLGSCHPGPTVAVTALVTLLAWASGRDAPGSALVAATVLTGQLAIGWSNDLLDRERDAAVGRRDKPLVTGAVSPGLVRAAAVAALVCCAPLSLANGLVSGLAHLGAVGWGLAYDAGLKSGVWSGVPYAASFGLQVVFVSYGGPNGGPPSPYVVLAAALLAVGAHLTNAAPDLHDDEATGVRGLPHRLGPRVSVVAAAGCFVASVGLVVWASTERTAPATLALAAAAVALAAVVAGSALLPGATAVAPGRWLFRCAIAVGALGVAMLVLRGGVR